MIFRKQSKPSQNHPLFLAFGGKEKSGKTTAASYIVNKFGGRMFSFAAVLKASVYDLNAIRGKEMNEFLDYAKSEGYEFDFHGLPRANMSNPKRADKAAWINRNKEDFRQILQVYGDFKRADDPDIFINRTIADIQKAKEEAYTICVDDVRFYNEVHALEDVGFTTVRVNAGDEVRKARGAGEYGDHVSETQLDSCFHSFIVHNNLLPVDLYNQLDTIAIEVINAH